MQLLTSHNNVQVMQLMLRKLAPKYGPARATGDSMTFAHEPPSEEINLARSQAIQELNLRDVLQEADRRVNSVVNLESSWALINLLSDVISTKKEEKARAKAFLSWAQEMRRVAETLIDEPDYQNDSMWPPVPDIIRRRTP